MLAKKEKLKNEVFEICKNSPDIDIGDSLFVTEDKLYYFTASGGWGEKDRKLVAIDIYGMLHFKAPSGTDELRNCIKLILTQWAKP